MVTRVLRVALVAVVGLGAACQKADDNDLFKLGGKTYTREDFEQFSSMARFFPLKHPQVFPAFRKTVTNMLETELIYQSVPGSFRRTVRRDSDDWKWREQYYRAQLYMVNVLVRNLSFSEAQLQEYYDAHREDSFKAIVKVPVKPPVADTADSAAVDTAAQQMRDSVAYKSLADVRDRIVKQLFIATFPPDSGYIRRFFGDSAPDPSVVNEQWYQYMSRYIRTRDQDFFLNRFYKEYYGTDIPDSVHLWIGEGKAVTDADLDLILAWLPESEQSRFTSERGRRELGRWVLRWKVYARKAEQTGYANAPDVTTNLAWAWKYHVVNAYLDKELLPELRTGIVLDTALCTYSLWDERSSVSIPPDSAQLSQEIENKISRQVSLRLDSLVYQMRKRKGVTFLQSDYRDDKEFPPEVILAKADSLRDTGSAREAEQEYRKLTVNYPLTDSGASAFSELAKLLTERQSYKDAIRTYRLQLFHTDNDTVRCNTYFMIGFIYDEYMNEPELAEQNYRWVLKNTPWCELADDAEFMMLHLDEPMIRIEDLRSEALRQGRKVEYDDELDEELEAVDTTSAPK